MILAHFTAKPFTFDPQRTYKPDKTPAAFKPTGLWLSDEREDAFGWREWCEGEQWNTQSLVHRTEFAVVDDSRWLILDTPEKVLSFTREFKVKDPQFEILRSIDWEHVQANFAGILISPYQWTLRLEHETFWYYGWDCASACVWDLKTIKEVPR